MMIVLRVWVNVLLCVTALWLAAPGGSAGDDISLDEEVRRANAGARELDEIIGVAFKLLAKRHIADRGLNQVQNSLVDKLRPLSEEDFSLIYRHVYDVIGSVPQELRMRRRIGRDMFKFQLVEMILALDEQSADELVDAISNRAIAEKFRLWIKEGIDRDSDRQIAERINRTWQDIARAMQ